MAEEFRSREVYKILYEIRRDTYARNVRLPSEVSSAISAVEKWNRSEQGSDWKAPYFRNLRDEISILADDMYAGEEFGKARIAARVASLCDLVSCEIGGLKSP